MRILFVTLPRNQHSVRHINTIAKQGWDVHVFPAYDVDVLPDLRNVTVYHLTAVRPPGFDPGVRIRSYEEMVASTSSILIQRQSNPRTQRLLASSRRLFNQIFSRVVPIRWAVKTGKALLARRARKNDPAGPGTGSTAIPQSASLANVPPSRRAVWLAQVIHEIKPDLINAQTIFMSGYLLTEAREIYSRDHPGEPFPRVISSNWGMDIHFLQHSPYHREKIKQVLAEADFYTCECDRDVELARNLGFNGKLVLVTPIGGGFDLDHLQELRQPGPTSERRLIMIKGYQNLLGRSVVALHALELCRDVLEGYRIAIYLFPNDYTPLAEVLSSKLGIPIEIIPESPHDTILKLHGQARVSIGLSLSDGISTSMLEAMIMGSFPIQSNTACADEWIEHGTGGLMVEPEDPYEVAQALRRALTDDQLVNHAAEVNLQVARERLGKAFQETRLVEFYKNAANER